MAVKIQKQRGEIAYFYPKVGNVGAAQTAVINIRVGEWWSLGAPFDMPADSENKYELSGQVLGPVGIYDVFITVAHGIEGDPIADERLFPGEFEVIEAPVGSFTLYGTNFPIGPLSWDGFWWDQALGDWVPDDELPKPLDQPGHFTNVNLNNGYLFTYVDSQEFGPYGPFNLIDGATYTLDVQTGQLTEGMPPPPYYDQPLYAGWNTIDNYLGATLPCDECFESIMSYLIQVWHYVYPGILIYVPGAPDNTLTVITTGKAYMIEVTQDCIWRYPLP